MSVLNGSAPTAPVVEIQPYERDSDGAILFDPQRVRAFPDNPRKKFRRIPELAESIKISGQRDPGKVILMPSNPRWDAELVDGERRLRACKLAGLKFRAYPEHGVVDIDDQFERSFVSNFGREDHDCVEIARSIDRIMKRKNRSLSQIAAMAGKSITWATQHLNLLKLHPTIQEMLVPAESEEQDSERAINFSLAQLLVKESHQFQLEAARAINREKMGIVKARRYILQLGREKGRPIVPSRKRPQAKFQSLMGLSENLRDSFGIFLDMKDAELEEMLKGVNPESKILLLERLVEFDSEVTQFIDVLRKKVEFLQN